MPKADGRSPVHLGFKTSIITLFVVVVLVIGLTLVFLSFSRMSAVTQSAAGKFIDKVAELSAGRIDTQLRLIKSSLDLLSDMPPVQTAAIGDGSRLYPLMASMLRNNEHLFSLYIGYDDGSFVELDYIDRAGAEARERLQAPEGAVFRGVLIFRRQNTTAEARIVFLDGELAKLGDTTGPRDFDPRNRPWYVEAGKSDRSGLTGPYVFFATRKHGYTVHQKMRDGRTGVVAGDIILDTAEQMLNRDRLTASSVAFLFDDAGRVLAHPDMSHYLRRDAAERGADMIPHLRNDDMNGVARAIRAWKQTGIPQQFFYDADGRQYAAAFRQVEGAGAANLRVAVLAPFDEFFATIVSERSRLVAITLGFVVAMLPLVFLIGSLLSKSLQALADQTDRIQRFELGPTRPVRSSIREIDELGRSVSTMRVVAQTFSQFVPKRLVQQLVETGTALELGGTRRDVTLLFTDVAGFTELTERADPAQVMQYTSRYFAAISNEIMAHGGTVDKFIGDGLMAMWNAPADDDDHVLNACAAALALVRANERLNAEFEREGWPAYHTRCGLHTGDAIVGNVGSTDRMNYTALGANVNLAARLEGLNKNYGTSILVSEAVRDRASHRFEFRAIDRIRPKGFDQTFQIYELIGPRDDSVATGPLRLAS